jgi:transcription-repair coupling factor (superfamily II helicase)
LYAKRQIDKGSVCTRQLFTKRLESSFIYDTPDQTKSTQEVKADMGDRPMDRLVVAA